MNATIAPNMATYLAAKRRILRRRRRFGIAAMATVLAMVFGVVPAFAQTEGAPADPGQVVFADLSKDPAHVVVRSTVAPSTPTVSINGVAATVIGAVARGQSDYETDNVLVIDNSSTSATRYDQIKEAANRYIDGMEPGERVLIVSAGGAAKLEAPFTADQEKLRTAVETLSPAGTANLYSAISKGARTLSERQAHGIGQQSCLCLDGHHGIGRRWWQRRCCSGRCAHCQGIHRCRHVDQRRLLGQRDNGIAAVVPGNRRRLPKRQ